MLKTQEPNPSDSFVFNDPPAFHLLAQDLGFVSALRIWLRNHAKDIGVIAILCALPFLAGIPVFLHTFYPDPMYQLLFLTNGGHAGITPGMYALDPEAGWLSESLGRLAATDWIHGIIPWWNPYQGVGLPLAADMQSSAFFPFTMLLLLPNGQFIEIKILQIVAAAGMYVLLKKLGLHNAAAITGAILFEFNGTLAWFNHAAAYPVPFLPWILYGVEQSRSAAQNKIVSGWRWLAAALTLAILAGFPETAYLYSFVIITWIIVRFWGLNLQENLRFAANMLIGAVVALALCAPLLIAFVGYMKISSIGQHQAGTGQYIAPPYALPNIFLPYLYGNIGTSYGSQPPLNIWAFEGGFVGAVTLVLASYALYGKKYRALRISILAISVLMLLKTFGVAPIAGWFNYLPLMAETYIPRFAPPVWEFSFILLAAFAIEDIATQTYSKILLMTHSFILLVFLIILPMLLTGQIQPLLNAQMFGSAFYIGSIILGTAAIIAPALLLCLRSIRIKTYAIGIFASLEAIVLFTVPVLTATQNATLNLAGIQYLQQTVGLQRMYTLGPVAANYASYFGFNQINTNDLPISQLWSNYFKQNADSYAAPYLLMSQPRPLNTPSAAKELMTHLAVFEDMGVQYIVVPSGENLFTNMNTLVGLPIGNQPIATLSTQIAGGLLSSITIPEGSVDQFAVYFPANSAPMQGELHVRLCSYLVCETGARSMTQLPVSGMFNIPLEHPLAINGAQQQISYLITLTGINQTMNLPIFSTPAGYSQNLGTPAGTIDGNVGLLVGLHYASAHLPAAQKVYADSVMTIYKLANAAPFYQTTDISCNILQQTENSADIQCNAPTSLTRRELYLPGWSATINGTTTTIAQTDSIFQSIQLPAGVSHIQFSYTPPNEQWGFLLFLAGCLFCFGSAIVAIARFFRKKFFPQKHISYYA